MDVNRAVSRLMIMGNLKDMISPTIGKIGKPNPPTPLRAREGGAGKPLPASLRGWGGVI